MINPFNDKVFKDGFSIVASMATGVSAGICFAGLVTGAWQFPVILLTLIASFVVAFLVGAFVRYNTRIEPIKE